MNLKDYNPLQKLQENLTHRKKDFAISNRSLSQHTVVVEHIASSTGLRAYRRMVQDVPDEQMNIGARAMQMFVEVTKGNYIKEEKEE